MAPPVTRSVTGADGSDHHAGVEFRSRMLSASTVTATESVSVSVPPVPVEPRSLVVIEIERGAGSAVGLKLRPSSAALIAACVPLKVMVASAVPSPVVNVRPAVPASVSAPLVPERVTRTVRRIRVGDADRVAVGARQHQRRAGDRRLRARHGVHRRVVDRRERDRADRGVALVAAGIAHGDADAAAGGGAAGRRIVAGAQVADRVEHRLVVRLGGGARQRENAGVRSRSCR